jgi:hypothetical protein
VIDTIENQSQGVIASQFFAGPTKQTHERGRRSHAEVDSFLRDRAADVVRNVWSRRLDRGRYAIGLIS